MVSPFFCWDSTDMQRGRRTRAGNVACVDYRTIRMHRFALHPRLSSM